MYASSSAMEYNSITSSLASGVKAIPDYWCSTKADWVKCSFKWIIYDYSLCCEKMNENLQSSTFPDGANNDYQWRLDIPPKTFHAECKYHFSPRLTLVASKKEKVKILFKFSILNTQQEPIHAKESENVRYIQKGTSESFCFFIKRDYLLSEKNGLLFNDVLTFLCEIWIVDEIVKTSGQVEIIKFKDSQRILSENLGNLLVNEKFSDVTLAGLDGREFKAHKSILAARSEVFAAMFEHEMEEANTNHVSITDIESKVLKDMLHFIYTGTAPNLNELGGDLLVAADKYAIKSLKEMCEGALYVKLSVETAVGILILADLHSANQLKEQAINFITSHATDVMETTGWKDMATEEPHLIVEICRALAKH